MYAYVCIISLAIKPYLSISHWRRSYSTKLVYNKTSCISDRKKTSYIFVDAKMSKFLNVYSFPHQLHQPTLQNFFPPAFKTFSPSPNKDRTSPTYPSFSLPTSLHTHPHKYSRQKISEDFKSMKHHVRVKS